MADNVRIIKPTKGLFDINFKEVWNHRELLYFLAWKDVKVRYKQTILGASWAVVQPVLTMIVFSVIFGVLLNVPSEGVPYPIFAYSGLVLWIYFSSALTRSSSSLLSNSNLLSKVYFPRLILPLSACLAGLVDYGIATIVLVGLMLYYNVAVTAWILLVLLLMPLAMMLAVGLGFWLSALSVKYRDVQHALPFFVQMLLYATPIIYPLSLVGGKYGWILELNPLTGIVSAHRAAILGNVPVDFVALGFSAGVATVIFLAGIIYFKNYEKEFADVI